MNNKIKEILAFFIGFTIFMGTTLFVINHSNKVAHKSQIECIKVGGTFVKNTCIKIN